MIGSKTLPVAGSFHALWGNGPDQALALVTR